jgi:hypothetical protein
VARNRSAKEGKVMFETIYYPKPQGDKLFKYLSENLKGCELDGYTRMAAFYQSGVFKGCAALNFTEDYCGLDIYAPEVKFTRRCLREFFKKIFTVSDCCLCVIKSKNVHSINFVLRLGFQAINTDREEMLFKFTKKDFKRSVICARG